MCVCANAFNLLKSELNRKINYCLMQNKKKNGHFVFDDHVSKAGQEIFYSKRGHRVFCIIAKMFPFPAGTERHKLQDKNSFLSFLQRLFSIFSKAFFIQWRPRSADRKTGVHPTACSLGRWGGFHHHQHQHHHHHQPGYGASPRYL